MINNQNKWSELQSKIILALSRHQNELQISDTPTLPLAYNEKMPTSYDFDHGNINFAFQKFKCKGIENIVIDWDKSNLTSATEQQLILTFKQLQLDGKYVVSAHETLISDLDTAGTMLPIADSLDFVPRAAGADEGSGAFSPDEKEVFLNQAREQRTRLMETDNGQKLMSTYKEHNETYNELFKENQALRTAWKGNGATAEMSKDTSKALKNNDVVNPDKTKKTYGVKNASYNANAFTQQTNVAFASFVKAKNKRNSKYWHAGKAALGFGKSVSTTGNTKKKITELKGDEVFDSINDPNAKPPKVSDREGINVLFQGMGDGGAVAEARSNDWIVLDEEDRKNTRALYQAMLLEEAAKSKRTELTVWQGPCYAAISNAEAAITLNWSKAKEGTVTIQESDITITLPGFEFELDDSKWKGVLATKVRDRMAKLFFVRSLLHSQISEYLKKLVTVSLKEAFI